MNTKELQLRKVWWSNHKGDLNGYRERFGRKLQHTTHYDDMPYWMQNNLQTQKHVKTC